MTTITWRIFWIPEWVAPGPATAEGRCETTSAAVAAIASPSRISQRPKRPQSLPAGRASSIGSLAMSERLLRVPGVVLVSVAAAMWGLDGLIRKPLADSTSAYTIVFGEHVVLVLVTLPLL